MVTLKPKSYRNLHAYLASGFCYCFNLAANTSLKKYADYVVNVVLYFISAYHVFDRERYVNETKLSKFHENFYLIT